MKASERKLRIVRPCRECRDALAHQTIPSRMGEHADTRVTLQHLPVLDCPRGHGPFLPGRDFQNALLDWIGPHLPMPKTDLLGFGKLNCRNCGGVLTGNPAPWRFEQAVTLADASPFSIMVECPGLTCSACQRAQYHRPDWEAFAWAVDSTFNGLKPLK